MSTPHYKGKKPREQWKDGGTENACNLAVNTGTRKAEDGISHRVGPHYNEHRECPRQNSSEKDQRKVGELHGGGDIGGGRGAVMDHGQQSKVFLMF